ncbi:hypothetical protein [Nannocystis sp. SCPEA4]|uniref:hypothetical protein n=1 Tax=Nannocystis sp. SCPEA4 TaxID=2996787 RepID=UPI0022707F11|nr:hypothetical protein [Nannocystis sp. SCPEA4]MCY1056508.1 hypothetical protein [Nannocystis sp. SCPEA4]
MADELLNALGRLEREQRAAAAQRDDDPLVRPLAADERETLLNGVLGRLQTPASAAPPSDVVALAPRRRARWLAGLGSLAAAAVVAIVLLRGGGEPALDVPAYALIRGGDATSRSHDAPPSPAPLRLRADSPVDLVLAPATPVAGPVDVRLVASQDGASWWISGDATVSSDGVVRLRGQAAWGLTPGRWQLAVLIGRPDRLPADLAAWERAAAGAPEWQVVSLELEVVGAD